MWQAEHMQGQRGPSWASALPARRCHGCSLVFPALGVHQGYLLVQFPRQVLLSFLLCHRGYSHRNSAPFYEPLARILSPPDRGELPASQAAQAQIAALGGLQSSWLS